MNYAFTDEQLLNLVNNTIRTKLDLEPSAFTGGSVQITSTNNHQVMKYKVTLFFGYTEGRNPVNRTLDIEQELVSIWMDAILLKCKAMQTASNGMGYLELNHLMNTSKVEVVSSKVEVVSSKSPSYDTRDEVVTKGSSSVFSVDVISYLNSKAKTNYRQGIKKTISLIDARRKEGFTLDDFKTVIDKKVAVWLGDTKMQAYLRPETLFGTKFESYLNEVTTGKIDMKNVNAKNYTEGKF